METWKTSGRDGDSVYLRRHWYRIVTDQTLAMTIYCQRQARKASERWWVYSVLTA
jgi:hypothetical protein